MSERNDKSVVDQALDAFVYAPLGLLLEARDLLPKMAERGRGQVALTRLAGKVAAQRGRIEAERVVGARRGPPDDDDDDADADLTDRATADLPIDDFDTLSAPKILPQLESMSAAELDALLTYEQGHRARATVINRIMQLRA